MLWQNFIRLAILLALTGGCRDDGTDQVVLPPPPAPPVATGVMSATIDNLPWSSTAQAIALYDPASHGYSMYGVELGSAPARAISINMSNLTVPGTYTLGSYGSPSSLVTVSSNGLVWESTGSAASGKGVITIDIATPSRFRGVFHFDATPSSGSPNAAGTKRVVSGTFDLAIP